MRFNAVIAAAVLAVAVSGAALPAAEDTTTTEVSAPETPAEAPEAPATEEDYGEFAFPEDFDFDSPEYEKRSADPEAGWTW